MQDSLWNAVKTYKLRKKSRRVFRYFARTMGCIVAFVTTYALILPAITLEKESFCGFEEHKHIESCYIQQAESSKLICGVQSFEIHTHTSGCYNAEGNVTCGQADYLVHKHDTSCYDHQGVLVCTLPERSQHVHSSSCYRPAEPILHIHSDACKVAVKGDLICTQEESAGHKHAEACYQPGTELLCSKEVGHQHGESCYTYPLTCTVSTEPHFHDGSCYTTGAKICDVSENHVHSGECLQQDLICDNTEEDHIHDDACYRTEAVCGIPEGHVHGSACYERQISCGKSDGEAHVHGDGCYSTERKLICELDENHEHISSCYRMVLNCEVPETDGHSHGDDCYQWNTQYACGLEEGAQENLNAEPVLVCTEPVAQVHVHGEGCFETTVVSAKTICGADHEHSYSCYELGCNLEEHEHWLQCYSNPEADVENVQTWEATMKHVRLTGNWNEDVALIAESQLGYTESTRNYTVWEDGSKHGYTRYGAWYSVPHGDWCGMFASFCLHYAGVKGMPYNYGVRPWIEQLSKPELDLYRTAEEYTPVRGDLVFFDWEDDGLSDHVGIVFEVIEATETTPAKLKTIEGNSSNRVQFVVYDLDSPKLLGYSMLPENPENAEPEYFCRHEEHKHETGCRNENDELICGLTEHVHNETCLQEQSAEPEYHCGLEVHAHEASVCYDAEGNLICEKTAHEHSEACLTEPPVYYCGQEVHAHEASVCYDAEGNLICEKTEHEHSEACLTEPPVYYCGLEVHAHEASVCYDAEGNLICEKTEHEHNESCLTVPQYHCGLEEHTHDPVVCYDTAGNLICEKTEHQHSEICLRVLMKGPKPVKYYCGAEEHTHTDACKDPAGGLICELTEHTHTSLCLVDLSDLDIDAREKVEQVIRMIDEIPSADQIDAKIAEYEAAEDYEGEEAWLTEVYQEIGLTYAEYAGLTQVLQQRVVNRDKLLELEYIWSVMPLATYYVWLDGTNGETMSLYGSDNRCYTLNTVNQNPGEFTLPESWKSPAKYSYVLRGWYDIKSKTYYKPGTKVTITQNTVFYADWEAATYNIGNYDAHVVNTISTNNFVTTRLFDYSNVFNLYSSNTSSSSINQRSHSEKWEIVSQGTNGSYGIILRDWDTGGSRQLSWPTNASNHNTSQDNVTFGLLYNYNMYDLFFNPYSNHMGVEYLGTADHLFQYEKDPNSQYYGYYYYDSARNAASYNQSAGRFYVYDYLERTTTSQDNGKDSDFLPFNSIYTNNPENYAPVQSSSTSGQRIYTFDSGDQNANMAGTNFWFGMTTEIRFFLPNVPGSRDNEGQYGNKSLYGKDMEFKFSGDDDVFVLVDNQLVLDIGGMHDIKSGTINFSSGLVTVEGAERTTETTIVRNLQPGEHTLTLLYMERGSSMSNCSIYFNISPRFTLSLQKEDLLSNELLNGAEFQVFMDENCTVPATLWPSYQSYQQNSGNTTNTFTVNGGTSTIWGFAAGNTYYIRESKPPNKLGYRLPQGLIKMELSNKGVASYTVMVIPDPNEETGENNPSPGFTVEGFRIDEEHHVAYLIVTNSITQGETTEILVRKKWEGTDTVPITVYLLADGQRIREVTLSGENQWMHIWDNLPKYRDDPQTEGETTQRTEIVYTVEEASVPGYVGRVETITENTIINTVWNQVSGFTSGQIYLLKTSSGYLATDTNGGLNWVSEDTAKVSDSAQWVAASVNGTAITLRNKAGYYLRYQSSNWNSLTFYASTNSGSVTYNDSRFQFRFYTFLRYMSLELDGSGQTRVTDSAQNSKTAVFTLYQATEEETSETIDGLGFMITNSRIPETNQTALTVTKRWMDRDGVTAFADATVYQESSVPVKLLINGSDSGRSGNLTLRNGWQYTFAGLPILDEKGVELQYSVVENWDNEDWTPQYTEVTKDANGAFSIGITNVYSKRLDIPVEKKWDSSIHVTEMAPVEVRLYAAAGDNMEGTLVTSITLTEENAWKGVLKALPPELEGVTYYIHEDTDLFAPEYGEPTRIFINGTSQRVSRVVFQPESESADITVVTNRPLIALPKTGGTGPGKYTAAGALLCAAALMLLYEKHSKRRKGAT